MYNVVNTYGSFIFFISIYISFLSLSKVVELGEMFSFSLVSSFKNLMLFYLLLCLISQTSTIKKNIYAFCGFPFEKVFHLFVTNFLTKFGSFAMFLRISGWLIKYSSVC